MWLLHVLFHRHATHEDQTSVTTMRLVTSMSLKFDSFHAALGDAVEKRSWGAGLCRDHPGKDQYLQNGYVLGGIAEKFNGFYSDGLI